MQFIRTRYPDWRNSIYYPRCREYPFTINALRLTGKERLLDIGCKVSILPNYISSLGCEVTGIDLDETAITRTKHFHATSSDSTLNFLCMDATCLDFPSDYFDRVCSVGVFEHMDADKDMLAATEVGRVLRKGGIAVLTVEATNDPRKPEWFRCYDEVALRARLVEPSGLQLVELGFFADPAWFPFRQLTERKWFNYWLAPIRPLLSFFFFRQQRDYEAVADTIGAVGYVVMRKR